MTNKKYFTIKTSSVPATSLLKIGELYYGTTGRNRILDSHFQWYEFMPNDVIFITEDSIRYTSICGVNCRILRHTHMEVYEEIANLLSDYCVDKKAVCIVDCKQFSADCTILNSYVSTWEFVIKSTGVNIREYEYLCIINQMLNTCKVDGLIGVVYRLKNSKTGPMRTASLCYNIDVEKISNLLVDKLVRVAKDAPERLILAKHLRDGHTHLECDGRCSKCKYIVTQDY